MLFVKLCAVFAFVAFVCSKLNKVINNNFDEAPRMHHVH